MFKFLAVLFALGGTSAVSQQYTVTPVNTCNNSDHNCVTVTPKPPNQFTIVVPVFTRHFANNAAYNNKNYGVGIERNLTENVSVLAEDYENSINRNTLVVGASYTPVKLFNRVRLGAAAGVDCSNGYNKNPIRPLLVDGRAVIDLNKRWAIGVDILPGSGNSKAAINFSIRYKIGGKK